MALANAERHFRCAVQLAGAGELGVGNALLVLAGEEAIKALFLHAKGSGMPIPQAAMNLILTRHEARHTVAVFNTLMLAYVVRWAFLMFELEDRFPTRSGPEFWKAREEAGRQFIAQAWEMADPTYKGDKYTDSMSWWATANETKNSGLYVDFLDGRWSSPESVSQEAFSRSRNIVEDFIRTTKASLAHWDSLSAEVRSNIIGAAKKAYRQQTHSRKGRTRWTK